MVFGLMAEPEHILDEMCWCHPKVEFYGPPDHGVILVIHHSVAECLAKGITGFESLPERMAFAAMGVTLLQQIDNFGKIVT